MEFTLYDTAITQPVFVCSKPSMESPEQFDLWKLFKVNRKGNRTASLTSFWHLYC